MTKSPPLAGVEVNMGGTVYTVPPLNFTALEKYQTELATLGNAVTPAMMGKIAEVVHAAMVRNYPDMTLANVKDALDLGNFREVVNAMMGASGFTSKGNLPGEEGAGAV